MTDWEAWPVMIIGTTLERWGQLFQAGAASRGRDLNVSQHYKRWMEEIGCKSDPLPLCTMEAQLIKSVLLLFAFKLSKSKRGNTPALSGPGARKSA